MSQAPRTELRTAVGQFAVVEDWQANVSAAESLISRAEEQGMDLLVLPEGIMTRFIDRKELIREAAQSLDGPFMTAMLELTQGLHVTVVFGMHETSDEPRPFNTLVAIRGGEVRGIYRKLHLYDAFAAVESEHVRAGWEQPPIIDVCGFSVGVMTCYDVRFPEQARDLADRGAELIALPAAWAAGRTKEFQWATLVSARALDATVFVAASGESGSACIGGSRIVDPLGMPMAMCTQETDLATAVLSRSQLEDSRNKLPVLGHRRYALTFNPEQPHS
ncbi:nitrilase-related carbon-nitrogen hydrolase [Brevibacterium otitidis]|uniref:Nitrilase-related carbon-nitrogen hydrolase n=1 Tax=Brevibacterium otitidis TaxID=53364 RepID=A0ABV5X2J9_9MICO|nr:deaminated glutathione amidase [Brevibacterium otitidis]